MKREAIFIQLMRNLAEHYKRRPKPGTFRLCEVLSGKKIGKTVVFATTPY